MAKHAWEQCIDEYTELMMKGYDAWLDLAKKWLDCFEDPGAPKNTKSQLNPKQPPQPATASVTAKTATLSLRPTAFLDGAQHVIPATLVTLMPTQVAAGTTATIHVELMPPVGATSGKYKGAIVDADANVLTYVEVDVHVV